MLKQLLFTLIILFSFTFFAYPAFAQEKYTSTVVVTYAIDESGITHTTTNVVITNTTQNFYVSSYTLKLGFDEITHVKASDPGGPIIPVIRKTDTGQEIIVNFNSVVYGTQSKLPFTISFDTPNIATKNGDIWEVNIPGLASQNEFSNFTMNVVVPPSFGSPTYIKPLQQNNSLTFTKDQLGKSGISLAFGKSQIYAFHLSYHLQNTSLFPTEKEIALPPSTNYQDVSLTSLTPKPTNVRVDDDGNWIASYTLAPSQKIAVQADGNVVVNLYPKQTQISEYDLKRYTQEKPFWQQNEAIKTLAKKLQTPEAIYDYVVENLHYDFTRVRDNQKRLGAQAVLENPSSAVCLEFSDLFVALARAAGIPAREVDGYAYTQNTKERPLSLVKDVLHTWPEYYDNEKKQWIMVDPTWGNTTGGVDYFHTFDFDHIAFSIKGESSSYPIPAGGYKLAEDGRKKDITVTFSAPPDNTLPIISASLIMDDLFLSAFPISGSIVLKNTGTTLFPKQKIIIASAGLTPHTQALSVPDIPPLGTVTIPFSFTKTPFLTNTHTAITIALDGHQISKQIAVVPFSIQQLGIGGAILALFGIGLFIFARKSGRLSILRR